MKDPRSAAPDLAGRAFIRQHAVAIARLVAAGMSVRQVAEALGLPEALVQRLIRKTGGR
ncbi:MAG TPA: helix-turn-helix domain-containing protein [Steroidobacteraceae bacterium]|nr:helix-turn-helix domain-containing protein [Steroidobacteraceae bacterium]